MSKLESTALIRNRYFDELSATPGLYWLGQNTNHIESHPAVREAMLRSIEAGEFNAYAPPLGFEALRSAIVTVGTPRPRMRFASADCAGTRFAAVVPRMTMSYPATFAASAATSSSPGECSITSSSVIE